MAKLDWEFIDDNYGFILNYNLYTQEQAVKFVQEWYGDIELGVDIYIDYLKYVPKRNGESGWYITCEPTEPGSVKVWVIRKEQFQE